eukprot:s153_g30.t1
MAPERSGHVPFCFSILCPFLSLFLSAELQALLAFWIASSAVLAVPVWAELQLWELVHVQEEEDESVDRQLFSWFLVEELLATCVELLWSVVDQDIFLSHGYEHVIHSVAHFSAILLSLSAGAMTAGKTSSFFVTLLLTSATTKVCASNMSLFIEASVPTLGTMVPPNKVLTCSSVGVVPGGEAANARRANEVTPAPITASTSASVRWTSSPRALNASLDSSNVPIARQSRSVIKVIE